MAFVKWLVVTLLFVVLMFAGWLLISVESTPAILAEPISTPEKNDVDQPLIYEQDAQPAVIEPIVQNQENPSITIEANPHIDQKLINQTVRKISQFTNQQIRAMLTHIEPFNTDSRYLRLMPNSNLTGNFIRILASGRSQEREQIVLQFLDQHFEFHQRADEAILCAPKSCLVEFSIDIERTQYFDSEFLHALLDICANKSNEMTSCRTRTITNFFEPLDLESIFITQPVSLFLEFEAQANDGVAFNVDFDRFSLLDNTNGELKRVVDDFLLEQISLQQTGQTMELIQNRCKGFTCRAIVKNGYHQVDGQLQALINLNQYCEVSPGSQTVLSQEQDPSNYLLNLNCSVLIET